eukprot:scaffold110596_cov35-Tisochrysis_lutea.AAC.1
MHQHQHDKSRQHEKHDRNMTPPEKSPKIQGYTPTKVRQLLPPMHSPPRKSMASVSVSDFPALSGPWKSILGGWEDRARRRIKGPCAPMAAHVPENGRSEPLPKAPPCRDAGTLLGLL